MRTRFHQGLDDLKEKLLVMGGIAEQAVDKAVQGFRKRDVKLCREVIEVIEKQINRAEREIDELALDLLAMQQPMAVDLRFIMACMKINADLERVGDQAVNIAERGLQMAAYGDAELPADIPRMAATVAGMVRRALEAFVEGKAELADAVLKMDDIVDRMDDEIFMNMAEEMRQHPELSRPALDVLLVSRNLERVADHATNIAEDVIFWVRGADVRHGGAAAAAETSKPQ
jgi:phosphate transport system protein